MRELASLPDHKEFEDGNARLKSGDINTETVCDYLPNAGRHYGGGKVIREPQEFT